ncbi:FAD:protein FMN transferase [Oxalobacter sp. OttesenSCG-928-P03]|nr:FAD:protein FMN transferase [Oxalobacter sp. OttesenSCG-928-P03]
MDLLYKTQTRFLFHSHIRIKIEASWPDAVFDDLYAVLDTVDKKYNSYQSGSYIDLINRHAGSFVDVDDETVRILEQVIALSAFFDGTYDITVMPLIRLWGFYRNHPRRIPTPEEIESVRHLINYRNIEMDGNRVRIGKGQEIVTGSFIKAYATDRLAETMRKAGMHNAIVNAGGSTIRAINRPSDTPWQVSVPHPENEKPLFTLNLDNRCYSTSSQTTAFVDIDGKRYGHILNPQTGFPATNLLLGIATDSCMVGDILSTALFNETPDGFLEKTRQLARHHDLAGFVMNQDSMITATPGFEHLVDRAGH